MPRVVPSDVVSFIDRVFPEAKTQTTSYPQWPISRQHAGAVAGLLELVDKVPDELLSLKASQYSEFICSVAAIRDQLGLWQNQQNPNISTELTAVVGLPQLNPVTLIRRALVTCPDQNPSEATADLILITDPAFRANLRNDIAAIDRALSNNEWKAATVLAGATIEALLLWDLQIRRTEPERSAAVDALVTQGVLGQKPPADIERWVLHHYIEVSAKIPTIEADTATEARLVKNFRNLIHPGRSQRLDQKCDRGTALACVAALEHVVRDLSR